MIWAKLPAFRETLINGAKSINKSTEGDLFRTNTLRKKIERKCHTRIRCPSFYACFEQIESLSTF